jgi:hypothetical protein
VKTKAFGSISHDNLDHENLAMTLLCPCRIARVQLAGMRRSSVCPRPFDSSRLPMVLAKSSEQVPTRKHDKQT